MRSVVGVITGKAEAPRLALDRRRLQIHAAAGRLRRARIDRRNLMAAPDDLDQRRHREIRRAHEDEAERHCYRNWSAELGFSNHFERIDQVKSEIDEMARRHEWQPQRLWLEAIAAMSASILLHTPALLLANAQL